MNKSSIFKILLTASQFTHKAQTAVYLAQVKVVVSKLQCENCYNTKQYKQTVTTTMSLSMTKKLNNYRMWLASLSKQANNKQYRVISKTSTKDNNDTTFTRVSLEPIPTVFSTDSPDKVFTIAKEQRDTLTAYDGALLMYNTLVKQYDFTEKS